MKKFTVILGLVLSLTVIAACANKSIVGTWIMDGDVDTIYTFTADGKAIFQDHLMPKKEGTYSVTGTELTRTVDGNSATLNFSLSPDGNTLTFIEPYGNAVFTRQ